MWSNVEPLILTVNEWFQRWTDIFFWQEWWPLRGEQRFGQEPASMATQKVFVVVRSRCTDERRKRCVRARDPSAFSLHCCIVLNACKLLSQFASHNSQIFHHFHSTFSTRSWAGGDPTPRGGGSRQPGLGSTNKYLNHPKRYGNRPMLVKYPGKGDAPYTPGCLKFWVGFW